MARSPALMSPPSPPDGTPVRLDVCTITATWYARLALLSTSAPLDGMPTGIDAYMITAGPNTDEVVIATT
jgi:hypothetical protein